MLKIFFQLPIIFAHIFFFLLPLCVENQEYNEQKSDICIGLCNDLHDGVADLYSGVVV